MFKKRLITSAAAVVLASTFVLPSVAFAQEAKIKIGLKTRTVATSVIESAIRSQAKSQGVRLTDKEVRSAARSAADRIKAPEQDPAKGIVHIKFKKITICIAWGSDSDHC